MSLQEDEEAFAMQDAFDRLKYGASHHDLESIGLRAVKKELNSGTYGHQGLEKYAFVSAWVEDKEFALREEESSKRDAREAKVISIAEEANSIARLQATAAARAARYAMYAAIIAVIAAITANKDHIFELIALILK